MKLRMKILLTVLLAVFAAVSLMAVLTDLGVLEDWDGYVGVFCPPDGAEPVTVTDIRVGDLPLPDRLALTMGIPAQDHGQVVRLLEDLGP